MWRKAKRFWAGNNADDKRFMVRSLTFFVVVFGGEYLHWFVFTPEPRWLVFGWPIGPLFWCFGFCFRDERPRRVESAFVIAWVVGLLATLCSLQSVSALVFSWLYLAGFLVGLDYWPSPKPPVAIIVDPPPPSPPVTTFGSARWGTLDYMLEHKLVGDDGLLLGVIPGDEESHRLRYNGDRHLLTIAPNRTGKGTCAIIPNLLTYRGSCLICDPKAENAMITAEARRRMGQTVHVVDPFAISGFAPARFNPLDWLEVGDIDIGENAMLLADALVVPGKDAESFWVEEAKALLQGLILYVATEGFDPADRHLGTVRDLLTMGEDDTKTMFHRMTNSANRIVAAVGAMCLQKDPKLLASVFASAQSHTHFLNSPRIRDSLSASDFRFEDLKAGPTTIYLVLPADRLKPFGRWLRLLIQQAITVNARNIADKPDKAVLFILDEMPALGHLDMIEQAFGLMAGFGMQLWAIAQDASQLKRIYGESWETFVANAGAVTFFGSRDNVGAEYFSKLCGVATVLNFSSSKSFSTTHGSSVSNSYSSNGSSTSYGTSSSHTSGGSISQSYTGRKLAFPDELMRLAGGLQLVLIENHPPILAGKEKWFENPTMRALGRNLHAERLPATPPALPVRTTCEWIELFQKERAQ